jgi:hypothetical protein
MAVDSSSTLAEVEAAYDDNASYDANGSAAQCRAFMAAVRILLRRLPTEQGTRENNARWDMTLLSKELARAQEWLDANTGPTSGVTGTSSRVTRGSFTNFRE